MALFGSSPFAAVNNGIDNKRFAFNPETLAGVRERFGISQDTPLYGGAGRLGEAENLLFQIRTFAEILKLETNAYYLMVGDGDANVLVEPPLHELGLEDKVIMLDYLPNPAQLLSSGLLPSSVPIRGPRDCVLRGSAAQGPRDRRRGSYLPFRGRENLGQEGRRDCLHGS